MIVISDTSPVSGLIQIRQLQILNQLYSQIIIPQIVHDELSILSSRNIDLTEYNNANWIEVRKTNNQIVFHKLSQQLDLGEAEAIALALELKADAILIDEKSGRKIATQYGLRRIGLLGVLLEAKKQGVIPLVKPLINDLITKANFWASTALIDSTLKVADENP